MRFTNKKIFIFNLKHLSKMLCIGLALAFILSSCSSNTPPVEETSKVLTAEDIYALASPSTVEITASNSNFSSTGTGFFDDINGTVITNYHVIDGAKEAKIKTYDGKEYKVLQVLGYDEKGDIAILSTSCTSSTPLAKNPSPVATGQKVYALGSSLGLTGTFSEGIVSTASRDVEGTKYIQITAPISHGNSGGPLLDENGKVIGITTAGFVGGQNLNLAVPITQVNKIPRTKKLTIQELFYKTPAVERVIEYLKANGKQEIFVDKYKIFSLEQHIDNYTVFSMEYNESWDRLSIDLNYDDALSVNYRVSLSFSESDFDNCGLAISFARYDEFLVFDTTTTKCKDISNDPYKNIWGFSPDINNGNPTNQQLDYIKSIFYKDTAKLLNILDVWLKENNFSCSAEDFGFIIE